jgi:hypothetical protein
MQTGYNLEQTLEFVLRIKAYARKLIMLDDLMTS